MANNREYIWKVCDSLKTLNGKLEVISHPEETIITMVNCKLYFNLAQIDLFHVPKDLLDIQGELFDKLLKLVLFDNLNKDKWDKYLYGKFMLCLKKTLMCYVYQFGKPGNLLLTQKEYLNELLLNIVQVYYQNPILFEELDDFILYDVIVQKIKTDERYHRSLLILLRSSNISKGFSLWLGKSDIDTVYLQDIFGTDFKPRIKYFVKALRTCCNSVQNKMLFRFQQLFNKFILSNEINKFEYTIFIFQELNEFSAGLISRGFQAYLNQLQSPMFLELLTCCLDSSANCDIIFGTTVNTIERRIKDKFRQMALILSKSDHFVINEVTNMLKISTNSNGFNHTSTTGIYFQLLLNFFANNSKVNEKLEDLTIKLLLSTTLLGSPEFNIIVDFLFEAYSNYQEITGTHLDMDYLVPPIEVLERLNVSIKYPTRIQSSLLFENMIIFSRMIIKTYCVCTLRFILKY